MRPSFRGLRRSAALYPITVVYLAGVAITLLAVWRWATVPTLLIMFGVVCVLAVVWAALRELKAVHSLLLFDHDELLAAARKGAARGARRPEEVSEL